MLRIRIRFQPIMVVWNNAFTRPDKIRPAATLAQMR
jgi:hypothetical protein